MKEKHLQFGKTLEMYVLHLSDDLWYNNLGIELGQLIKMNKRKLILTVKKCIKLVG